MKVIVDGLATNYLDEGHGPAFLLLHGWANTLHSFDAISASLCKSHRIVRLDLPGFGATEPPPSAWNVEDYARFVRTFCEKIGLEPDTAIGHSLGGRILVKGLARRIFFPRKVILIASAGVAERNTVRNRVYKLAAKVGRALLWPLPARIRNSARRVLYSHAGGDYLTVGSMSGTFIKVISENLSESAKLISVPTLLIWGEHDVVTPLSEAKRLHTLIANSQLNVIKGTGHFVHQEKPEKVASQIQEFCI
jgi:pimeloyl-ACP methyl ester carboxylesterase